MEVEEGKSVLIFRESLNLKEEDELGLVFFIFYISLLKEWIIAAEKGKRS